MSDGVFSDEQEFLKDFSDEQEFLKQPTTTMVLKSTIDFRPAAGTYRHNIISVNAELKRDFYWRGMDT